MIVSERHKALVMALRNPGKVTTVIPKAKVLKEEEGRSVVAVPHSLDVYKVLKNIGLNPPHPIKHYYDWPCFYPSPMPHQIETAAFLTTHKRAYCLNGMGSAKTVSTLWAFDYLRRIGRARKMLVIAPLSTLDRTWADEAFRNFADMEAVVLYGTRAQRLKLLAQPADLYIINHDGIKVILPELLAANFDVLVPDELTQIARNTRSGRWKAAKQLVDNAEYVWGLTGTPIPNDPCDAYGQVKLLTPANAPRSFTMFKDMVSRLVGPFKRLPLPNAAQTVLNMMQPSIRYATEDCVELPPTIFIERHAPMSGTQEKAYETMRKQKIYEIKSEGIKVVAMNEAIVAMKLIQIACGAIITGEDVVTRIESPERMAVVEELLEESEGKVIIFCPVIGGVDYITEKLVEKYGESAVGRIDGRVPKVVRDQVFASFQNGGSVKYIVAQPATMSHGLTLTAGSMIVWYAPPYSNETFEQANARIVRPGQKRKTIIACIEGTDMERKIYKRLKERQKVQGSFLSMAGNLNK